MTNKNKSKKNIFMLLAFLLIAVIVLVVIINKSNEKPVKKENSQPEKIENTQSNIVFKKEGEVKIMTNDYKTEIVKIDVEIADTDPERMQGLMYRQHMEMNQGMLFLMGIEEIQGFWMKNTSIPLDIIYISDDKQIVSIHKNTVPFSLENIPSKGPASIVLEVNAGFSDLYNLKEGDRIVF